MKYDEAISLVEVTKTFRLGLTKKKTAVRNLTLGVPLGHVVGLLGPNGSGKSTTIKMILGFLKPTSGHIHIGSVSADRKEARKIIGYLPENPRFQGFLTARNVLSYIGALFRLEKSEKEKHIEYLLDLVGLKSAADERVKGFSKGMTQRLAMAQALINRPSLLILDEPMSGLDPLGRLEMRNIISRIHDQMRSATIFFSSHVLEDVEELCSHVAVLKGGKLTNYSSIASLLDKDEQLFDLILKDLPEPLEHKYRHEMKARKSPSGLIVTVSGTRSLLENLEELQKAEATVVNVTSHRRKLEKALYSELLTTDETPEVQS